MILTEFDENKIAVINPDDIQRKKNDFPETVVSIFHHILFNKIVTFLNAKKIGESNDVDGTWPVYEAEYKGVRIGLVKARLGAAACVGIFEEIIAMGAKRIILLGNCGVLDKSIEDCGIIIPTKAIRDEGTSYHYAPASDYIQVNKDYGELFEKMLDEYGYNHIKGVTWTTDAFFRETPEKIKRRKDMGAVCVEMECSAMQALCDFRDVEFFQFLYAGDNLDHPQWDPRSLNGYAKLSEKEKIAMLAVELAYRITAGQS